MLNFIRLYKTFLFALCIAFLFGLIIGAIHYEVMAGIISIKKNFTYDGLATAMATLFSGIIAFAGAWYANGLTQRSTQKQLREQRAKEAQLSLIELAKYDFTIPAMGPMLKLIYNVIEQKNFKADEQGVLGQSRLTAEMTHHALTYLTESKLTFDIDSTRYCNYQTQFFIRQAIIAHEKLIRLESATRQLPHGGLNTFGDHAATIQDRKRSILETIEAFNIAADLLDKAKFHSNSIVKQEQQKAPE